MHSDQTLFWTKDLSLVIDNQREQLKQQIGAMQLNQLGAVSFDQACAHLVENFTIDPLRIFEDQLELIDPREITLERYSHEFGEHYRRTVLEFRFELPFEGAPELFTYKPSQCYYNPPRAGVQTRPNLLVFVFQSDDRDGTKIRDELQREIQKVKDFIGFQSTDLSQWNASLEPLIRQGLETRRDKLQADQKLVSDLGFKIRRRGDSPPTISFPVARKTVTPMPTPRPAGPMKPTPVLELAAYEEILGNLAGMSVAIERNPSTFSGIGEEALRDWFLVALNCQFRGDATGETFNREGKADISIRVNGGVIFIAECKFWGGEKLLLETIDQLLGYLTWRDSKASLLIFSRNADFTAVLRQIPDVVRKHPHCRGVVTAHGETGVRFHLRDKTDPEREHLVTLLAFNVPRAV